MFTQRYWAIQKPWLFKNAVQTELNKQLHTSPWTLKPYSYMIRWSEAAPLWLLLNRSITFSSNYNGIIRPFICGMIHVDSNPLCSFPHLLHFWVIHALLYNYSLFLNEPREQRNEQTTNVFYAVDAGATKKGEMLRIVAFCILIVSNYSYKNCFVCLFPLNFHLCLRQKPQKF